MTRKELIQGYSEKHGLHNHAKAGRNKVVFWNANLVHLVEIKSGAITRLEIARGNVKDYLED